MAKQPLYLDPEAAPKSRAFDLVRRMSLKEKVGQMMHGAEAIPRLGVPAYNWWNEALHGVARAGLATVFPQSIGRAASFDDKLEFEIAEAIADEGRAKHHEFERQGKREIYQGLTFWSPNINIFRDPRWGRGQETFGEDPFLTGRLGVAFVKGLQGDHPRYVKTVATPKHFAVHSGPEPQRHEFDAVSDMQDLYGTYLPAFEECVKEGKAWSVMSAYNRTNGEACSASPYLLNTILRKKWGFAGYVVSDCGAVDDVYLRHKIAFSAEEAAALSVRAGCDLECGGVYSALERAVSQRLINEKEIDKSLIRLFEARMRLGMFDPPNSVPFAQIPYSVVDCSKHRELALRSARESMVLLKNEGDLLPLRHAKTVAVVGPNAADPEVLLGNYNGTPSSSVTPLAGMEASDLKVIYAKGCDIAAESPVELKAAVAAAQRSDVVVACLGLNISIEEEEYDRKDIGLHPAQLQLLQALYATGKPVVLVLLNGGPVSCVWAHDHIPAIVEAWYPGEEGGTAVADVLLGRYNPGGRLPVTLYRGVEQLPPIEDYDMRKGRTYRYFGGEPLAEFGFGLSYTRFRYSELSAPNQAYRGSEFEVSAAVENVGALPGDEVVQLYLCFPDAQGAPILELKGFERIHLGPGEKRTVSFALDARRCSVVGRQGRRLHPTGLMRLAIGGGQPGRDWAYADQNGVVGTIEFPFSKRRRWLEPRPSPHQGEAIQGTISDSEDQTIHEEDLPAQ